MQRIHLEIYCSPYESERLPYIVPEVPPKDEEMKVDDHLSEKKNEDPQADTELDEGVDAANENVDADSDYVYNSEDIDMVHVDQGQEAQVFL